MARVLCLIDCLMSGGAERQMSYLCAGLKKRGNEVKLIVFYPNQKFYDDEVTSAGITIEYNTKGRNPIKRIFEIARAVKEYKPDAVIAYKDGVAMSACLARCLTRFRLIVSERNTTQELTKYERLKFFLYRHANIIVPNSFAQGVFIQKNFPCLANRTHVITNMLDLSKFCPGEKSKDDNFTNIVTIARVSPQKNVLNYIRAIGIVKEKGYEFVCNWYGNSDPDYFLQAKTYARELGVEDRIRFHGPQKDVVSVYQSGDIFCLPSIYEGFPNALCEAMACGLPVVCSKVSDNHKIVGDEVDKVVFSPYKPQEIAESLMKMIDKGKTEIHDIGQNNRKRIANLCAEDAFLDKYEVLIRD